MTHFTNAIAMPPVFDAPPPDPDPRLAARAAEIAARIRAAAVEARGGSVVWLRSAPAASGPPAVLPPHLYDGTCGVTLFLAAHHHVLGSHAHAETVARALAPLVARIRELASDPARSAGVALPVGGMVGVGSFVYTLARIGVWSGRSELVEGARAAASLLTPARLAADRALDVVGGAAGAVLALLALDAADPSPGPGGETPLEIALRCGETLLERRVSVDGGPRAWPGAETPPLGGFAHGASGIAYALMRLHARARAAGLRDGALEGLAYERSLFDPGLGNWIDPRSGAPLEQRAWCHGAPGIALARLGVLDVEPDGAVRADLEATLALTRALPSPEPPHLCCGAAGQAEVLLHAGLVLGDASLVAEARAAAAPLLEDRVPDGESGFDPSLFRGAAGVGYTLLRLSRPDALPSPLLLA